MFRRAEESKHQQRGETAEEVNQETRSEIIIILEEREACPGSDPAAGLEEVKYSKW